jgi:KDO2-lipid IV(A) lauroyltransferase
VTTQDQRAARRWLRAWKLCRRLPEPLAFALGRLGGVAWYRADRRRREALRDNLGHVLGPDASAAAVERAVRRGFASYGRYWVEAFRLEDLSPAEVKRRMDFEGREHLDGAVASGRGVIFAAPHIGNWDFGAAWLGASSYPASAVVERLRPAELFERFAAYRRALGIDILPLEDGSETLRAILRVLRAGRLALLVCDRDLTGGGLPVTMFGAPTTMPGGPASLAVKTGALVLPCAVYQSPRRGRWLAVCRPPLEATPSGDARADALDLTRRLAAEFELLIARAPEQWHVLSRYWRTTEAAAPVQSLPPGGLPLRSMSPPDPLLTGGLPLGFAWPPVARVRASLLSPPDPLLTGGLPLGFAWPPVARVRASLLSPPDPHRPRPARTAS